MHCSPIFVILKTLRIWVCVCTTPIWHMERNNTKPTAMYLSQNGLRLIEVLRSSFFLQIVQDMQRSQTLSSFNRKHPNAFPFPLNPIYLRCCHVFIESFSLDLYTRGLEELRISISPVLSLTLIPGQTK